MAIFAENLVKNEKLFLTLKEFLNKDVIQRYEFFVKIVNSCIMLSLPQEQARKKKKDICGKTQRNPIKKVNKVPCTWWNETCDRAVRIKRAAFKSLRYKLDSKSFFNYKKN